jgi:hypothetical protein
MFNFLFGKQRREEHEEKSGGMISELPAETNLFIAQQLGDTKLDRAKHIKNLAQLNKSSRSYWKDTYVNPEIVYHDFARSAIKETRMPWEKLCKYTHALQDEQLVQLYKMIFETFGRPSLNHFDFSTLLCLIGSKRTKFLQTIFSSFDKHEQVYVYGWRQGLARALVTHHFEEILFLYKNLQEVLVTRIQFIDFHQAPLDQDVLAFLVEHQAIPFFKRSLEQYLLDIGKRLDNADIEKIHNMGIDITSLWFSKEQIIPTVDLFLTLRPDIIHATNALGETKLDTFLNDTFLDNLIDSDACPEIYKLLNLGAVPSTKAIASVREQLTENRELVRHMLRWEMDDCDRDLIYKLTGGVITRSGKIQFEKSVL